MNKLKEFFLEFSKMIFSVLFLGLIILHKLFPDLVLDNTSLYLLLFALLPWILPLIPRYLKSFKLPGGLEMEFQESKISEAISSLKKIQPNIGVNNLSDFPDDKVNSLKETNFAPPLVGTLIKDPALALVDMANDLEKRIIKIVRKKNTTLKDDAEFSDYLEILVNSGLISLSVASTFEEILEWRKDILQGLKFSPAFYARVEQLRFMTFGCLEILEGK